MWRRMLWLLRHRRRRCTNRAVAEAGAVSHHGQLSKDAGWDEDTRKVVERSQADEVEHIERWGRLLGSETRHF